MTHKHSGPVHVIYHADCRDGFGAAWAAWTVLGDETARYTPAHYGDQIPDTDPEGWLYILDFSYPLAQMQTLLARHRGKVALLDHHQTAMDELDGRIAGAHFDMERSGAAMAWEYFHPQEPVPEILLYVQDRDLWDWKLPHSKEINEALAQTEPDFHVWSALTIPELRRQGNELRAPAIEQIQRNLASASTSDVLGHAVPSVETDQLVSDTAHELLQLNPDAPFAAVYHHTTQNGEPVTKFSLRSRKGGTDVSAIARVLGGGGHVNAAGFTVADGAPVPPRPGLHPSDTRHYGNLGLAQLADKPAHDRTRDETAALGKVYELQLVADENALFFHGQPEAGDQFWAERGYKDMLAAHQVAQVFHDELPLPSVTLDPDPAEDRALKRAHYPGALTFPAFRDFHEHRDENRHIYINNPAPGVIDETGDLPF